MQVSVDWRSLSINNSDASTRIPSYSIAQQSASGSPTTGKTLAVRADAWTSCGVAGPPKRLAKKIVSVRGQVENALSAVDKLTPSDQHQLLLCVPQTGLDKRWGFHVLCSKLLTFTDFLFPFSCVCVYMCLPVSFNVNRRAIWKHLLWEPKCNACLGLPFRNGNISICLFCSNKI